MFNFSYHQLQLVANERSKEWEREMMKEDSLNILDSNRKRNGCISLKHWLILKFSKRKHDACVESCPETLCCQQ